MIKQIVAASVLAAVMAAPVLAAAPQQYGAPTPEEARSQVMQWVASQQVTDKTIIEEVGKLWAVEGSDLSARDVFDRVIATFALIDAETKQFVEACNLIEVPLLPPDAKPVLSRDNEFYTNAMRLFFARYLSQRKMYDESLAEFARLDAAKVLDPASYFYFKAVAEHQLLLKQEGLGTIATLLNNVEDVPLRYETVATLMQHELQALKVDSLDEVARKMKDVERRLDLARAGLRVQKTEDEIIATLDDIIEKLEQQGGT